MRLILFWIYWLGVAFIKLEQLKKAIKDYTKVIDMDPSNNLAFYNIGLYYFEIIC